MRNPMSNGTIDCHGTEKKKKKCPPSDLYIISVKYD
jgi:hypothetical protein